MPEQTTVLGERYLLDEVLGRGGVADVHRATDQLLSREVAVKVLRESTDNDTDRARFTSEARTLARLTHPGLVMVLDAGITSERPFLVMELVEGPSLSRALAEEPIAPQRAAAIGAEVAEALAYAHAEQVVHRDVKPGNILLGSDGRVRLADFGIARLIGDTMRHTRAGHAIGTPAYLSPEQVRGDDVTTAADVYSLGLVLLEILTGERAFPGTSIESATARLHRPPDVPDNLQPRWRELLTTMTAIEPSSRPTAVEVAAALRAPLDDDHVDPTTTRVLPTFPPTAETVETVETSPRPTTSLGRDLVRRAAGLPTHLRVVAAVVAAILVLIVVAAIAGGGGSSTEPPANTPDNLQQPLQDLHDAVEGDG